jgi:hypothetical protein
MTMAISVFRAFATASCNKAVLTLMHPVRWDGERYSAFPQRSAYSSAYGTL